MPGDLPEPTRNFPFKNYIGSVHVRVDAYWEPTTLNQLVAIVQAAEAQHKHLHAVGAAFSFEDLWTTCAPQAAAAPNDWIVNLHKLGGVLPALSHALTDSWQRRQADRAHPDKLVHVQAGVRLFDLSLTMEGLDPPLSLPTMGGAQGQHLAGVFSTSTHGSDWQLPPICDFVEAVHLVTTGGRQLWIEAASRPVTRDDASLRAALGAGPELQIVRDDDLLAAVQVSLGRFGIIYSVVFRATPKFRLFEHTKELPWRDVARELAAGVGRAPGAGSPFGNIDSLLPQPSTDDLAPAERTAGYRYFDLVFNPRKRESCWVRRRWKTVNAHDLELDDEDFLCFPGVANAVLLLVSGKLQAYAGAVLATGLFAPKSPEILARAAELTHMAATNPHLTGGEALAAALNAIWASQIDKELGWLVDEVTQLAISMSMKEKRRGKNWEISAGKKDPVTLGDCYRGNSVEVVFSLANRNYIDFIDKVLAEAGSYLTGGYMAVRFSRNSDALISMHNADHHVVCSIEITSLRGLSGNAAWLKWVEETAVHMGGRPHWGQQNHLTRRDVDRFYPATIGRWRAKLEQVVGASATFSNNYSQQRGLEPPTVSSLVQAAWLHGHKLQVEAPERLVRTVRVGSACAVEGRAGTDNWLHFAVPTPVVVDETRLSPGQVMLRYRASGGAIVHAVHVYDGEKLIAHYDGMTRNPESWAFERFAVPRKDVQYGLGISVGVRFPSAGGKLEFASAGCDFVIWT